ncbi:MAG: hypothetical protein FWG20_00485 [Candidatus Cloacimonetes bacterium]|nr:hypothetical protein [Candidatus Cloacimonadota bacterium]
MEKDFRFKFIGRSPLVAKISLPKAIEDNCPQKASSHYHTLHHFLLVYSYGFCDI